MSSNRELDANNRTLSNSKMKRSLVEKDGPSSAESDPKRHKKDESGSTKPKKDSNSKSVLVLTSTDVRKNNGKIYLADAKEISLLKETERGRYKKEMMFFKTMTEEDVEEELRRHFPILRNGGRFCCATVVEKKTRPRLEFHDDPPTVWDGITIHRRTRGNASLYVFFESGQGTSEVVCERTELQTVDSLQQQLETPMTKPMNKTSGKRKNDESDPAAKRAKEASVEPPFFNTRTPILFYPVNMAQIEPQGHPATSTTTMMQNHISLQKFYVDQSSRATGFPKNSTPVTH
ncbi:uncharacterized protein LOC111345833, partial [Stylophora pistillata]|uniref:uncharacterized protein LOC111345833 n=1 Tax=Stylophora pistillata TaxID=50429 RepID=UPI000C03FDB5